MPNQPNVYPTGDVVRLSASFFDNTSTPSTLVDPTVVTFYIQDPAGVVHQSSVVDAVVPGAVVRDGLGLYHLDITVPTWGDWQWRAVGSGAAVAQDWAKFYVRKGGF